MHHPYQCLATVRPNPDGPQFLLAASGHKLFSVSLENGTFASRWPNIDENDVEVDKEVEAVGTEEPPAKKRRLYESNGHEDPPNVIKLAVTRSQQHVVVVTAEDKCIRVFSISSEGQLWQLSARSMPKRPCAITFTSDDTDILCADKFGDVYSLPLLPIPEQEEAFLAAQKATEEAKTYVPAATELTVHSAANRKSLDAQIAQAKEKKITKTKEPLSFSHKLLLGHVSMLTDMLLTTIRPLEDVQKARTYILTADRDEHIRISRGPPQAYVIEGYCLGHHEFVNKLCLVEEGLLVSGGGDHELLVWDWLEQKVLNRINIVDAVERARLHVQVEQAINKQDNQDKPANEIEEDEAKAVKIAVSGLWLFEDSSLETEPQMLIACEGVPAILHIPVATLSTDRDSEDISFIPVDGNPLDIATTGNTILISTDTIHEPGSISNINSSEHFQPRLQAYQALGEQVGGGAVFKQHGHLNHVLTELNMQSTVEWHEKKLQTLLYSVENLRKRGGTDDSAE